MALYKYSSFSFLIATDVARSVFFVSLCLCVGRTYAVWGLTHVGPRNHVLDGVQIPDEQGNF